MFQMRPKPRSSAPTPYRIGPNPPPSQTASPANAAANSNPLTTLRITPMDSMSCSHTPPVTIPVIQLTPKVPPQGGGGVSNKSTHTRHTKDMRHYLTVKLIPKLESPLVIPIPIGVRFAPNEDCGPRVFPFKGASHVEVYAAQHLHRSDLRWSRHLPLSVPHWKTHRRRLLRRGRPWPRHRLRHSPLLLHRRRLQ